MFAYCLNNPVNFIDRNGETAEAIFSWWIANAGWLVSLDGPYPYMDFVFSIGFVCLTIAIFVEPFTYTNTPTYQTITIDSRIKKEVNEDEKNRVIADTAATTSSETVFYYGIDLYGGRMNVITGPLDFDDALAWASAIAHSNCYSARAAWGLYTEKIDDAFSIATCLGGIGVIALDPAKGTHLPHFHTAGRMVAGAYAPSFHVWFNY